jgi:hypothetical protein
MPRLLQAFKDHGISVTENRMDADAAVIWSCLWAGRMQGNRYVYDHYRLMKRPVFIVEVGALQRNILWKVSLNHVNALGIHGHQINLDWDRPAKLGLSLQSRPNRSRRILIAAQHTHSLQVQHQDHMRWILNTIQGVRQHTDMPITVRPHPRSPMATALLPRDVDVQFPRKLPNTYDSFDFDFDWHAVINFCSGPGIQAALNGVPVIVDPVSLAHPVSIDIQDLVQPPQRDRQQWWTEICHTEYTLEEIQQGSWLKRLSDWL